jgi:hypothetical protein
MQVIRRSSQANDGIIQSSPLRNLTHRKTIASRDKNMNPPLTANAESDWAPCPAGRLGRLARDLSDRRRRRLITRGATGVCLIVLLVLSVRQMVLAPPLTCAETRSHVDAFLDETLAPTTRRQVERHLSDCPHCQAFYANQSASSSSTSGPNV